MLGDGTVVVIALIIFFTLISILLLNKISNPPGIFMIAGKGSTQISWSHDGKKWFSPENPPFGSGGIAYDLYKSKNIWVASGLPAGGATRQLIWSEDNGRNWNDSTGATFSNSGSTAYAVTVFNGNGIWVAGGQTYQNNSNIMVYSGDGKNWKSVNGNPFGTQLGLCQVVRYVNGRWFAGGTGGDANPEEVKLWTSTDGVNWSETTGSAFGIKSNSYPREITYGNDVYVAVGNGDAGELIWTSSDGISFSAATSDPFSTSTILWDVKFYNGLFVAVGNYVSGGNVFAWSTDGDTWTGGTVNESLSEEYFLDTIITPDNTGRWLAAGGSVYNGDGKGLVYYSEDGKYWILTDIEFFLGGDIQSSASGFSKSIGRDERRAILVGKGSESNIYYSDNRLDWVQANSVFGVGSSSEILKSVWFP